MSHLKLKTRDKVAQKEEKSFYITTLGCPKNIADSRKMRESLIRSGFLPSEEPGKSDFHFINSCTFIKGATKETIETIMEAGELKKNDPNQKLIVVGCFAERYPDEIKKEIPEVDCIFGTGKYENAGTFLKEQFPNELKKITSISENLISRESLYFGELQKPYAFVKISDGCNRGCHFCIIPKLRGSFRDAPKDEIIKECQNLISVGTKEICLVSQDTVFYGKDTDKLKNLVQDISELEGLELLRLLYLYPDKKAESLLDLVLENVKIAPYFESPIQHVSEKILKSMNRIGSYSFYKDLFAKARQRETLEIRTSVILGFPGENSEDVDLVLKFLEEVKPEKLAIFGFSPEENTKACDFSDRVPEKEINKRVNLVRDFHLNLLKEIQQSRVGKVFDAIVSEKEDEYFLVRRFQDAPEIDEIVFVQDKNLKLGDIGKVRIDSFGEYDMEGTWVR